MTRTLSTNLDRLAVAILVGFGSVSSTLVAVFLTTGMISLIGAVLAGIIVPAVSTVAVFGRYEGRTGSETTVLNNSDDRSQHAADGGTELK